MSLPSLLHQELPPPMQPNTFSWEHEQAHRQLWASMAPLDRFSVLPYILDPGTNGGGWHLDHQQAHNDVQDVFPGYFGGFFGFFFDTIPTGQVVSQLGPAFNIEDYDLDTWAQREWWTFQNHYFHLIAESVQNSADFVYPFF